MLGLALSVGASGVLSTQSEASAAISVPETSATDQAFSSDSRVSDSVRPASQSEIVGYHTVASGQSLWQIAQLHRVGLQDLKAANELQTRASIRVGQILKVPGDATAAQSPTQRIIQNLALGGTEPVLVANSNLALSSAETVAKVKISEQRQSEQRQSEQTQSEQTQAAAEAVAEIEAAEGQAEEQVVISERKVPQLDEAQVSIEIASADVELSEQSAARVAVSAQTAVSPDNQVGSAEPADGTAAPQAVSVEFDIADASLAERRQADSVPVVTALVAPTPTFASYQIQAGDTIAGIADSLGTTAADLISANDLADPDVIMAGATLRVPMVNRAARQLSQPPTSSTVEGSSDYSRLAYLQSTALRQNSSDALEDLSNNDNAPSASSASTDGEQTSTAQGGIDPYVANLLEEVQEIQSEPVRVAEAEITKVENRVPSSPRIAPRVAIAPNQTSSQADTQTSITDPSLLAAAPLSPDAYIPAQRSPAGQMVSPNMPLLPEADEFLPEAPNYFNGYIWPTRGTLTSGYGWRWGRMHRGVDVAGPVGTPIVAAGNGVVESAGWNSGGYGNMVEIRHPDGSLTLYAHNSRLNVSTGQIVRQGQQIAEMGSTGYSTGPHLHFEIHLSGKGAVNPIAHLPRR
ncbi:MAG: peptidoglycan DD-metalloendopeptidase family protein [Cyanobacteria bacterium P01_D01_bin.1]